MLQWDGRKRGIRESMYCFRVRVGWAWCGAACCIDITNKQDTFNYHLDVHLTEKATRKVHFSGNG